jgi:hypothetical protein
MVIIFIIIIIIVIIAIISISCCRWEAHVWVKELGRQVYLGGYDEEEDAAEAYDVAILKCKGPKVATNLEISR